MKHLNHVIILALASLTVILAGCKHERTMRIGVSQCSDDDWRRKMNEEIGREAMFHDNIEVEIRSANDNNEKQISDLRYFLDNGFDIIVAAPNEANALTPILKEIYDRGIPVVLFDRGINGDSYTAFQGADNVEIGHYAARKAASYIKEGGKILEITGLDDSSPAEEREKGFDSQAQLDGFDILAHADGKWNYEDAESKVDSLLNIYPDVDLIFAHNDRMAIAAKDVARRHGRGDIKVIGIDAAPTIGIPAVADSVIDASFVYPTEGYQLIRTAVAILEGEPYEKVRIFGNPIMVDTTNASILLRQDEALRAETEKINVLSGKIDTYWKQHSLQTAILYGAVSILILLAVVIFLLLRAYWTHKRHRLEVERRNEVLAQQKDELANQKEELAKQKEEISILYQQLQDATQSKLTFFTNVSHDLRTPLTLISDPVAQLSEAANLTPSQHTLMQLANKNVKILMRLINQILDIRKFDNGQLKLRLANVNIGTYVHEWAIAFANAAKKRHIKFNIDVDTSTDMDTAVDIDKMERVVFNLVSNAFKFTPENGSISISAKRDESNIIIKVSDTGCGIPSDEITRVFDRFFKTDNVNPQGSGIGLALSKVFVEMHSGRISVESSEHAGTVFTIVLPVAHTDTDSTILPYTDPEKDTDELMALEAEDIPASPDGNVVLVIDDNADIRALVKSVLADKYTVIQANSGVDGIRKASKYIPNLILCDVMMPGMDGFETCRRIKSEVVTSHIPVLLLTACSQDTQRIEGYECGADGYMSKPFDSKVLLARCDSLIKNRRLLLNAAPSKETPISMPSAAAPKHDIDDEFYIRFVDALESQMSNSELTVEDLADKLGLSRVQMYRKIKALTNYSPTELMRIIRLKRASTLLKTTDASVSEVCYTVGFSSPSYFTKCYKEYFNESPSDTQNRTSKIG